MCAFANDLHNWGGGYIVIGIDENDGKPILPPVGLKQNSLDKIQKEILNLAHQIQPNYFPIIQPYILQNKHILILWCPAGDRRIYTAPTTLGGKSQRKAYVRVGSETIEAKGETLRQLQEISIRIPFDDQVNHQATINNLDLGLIREYLQETESGLFDESTKMPFPDLARAMLIARGPAENLLPVNVGLLFFSERPEDFFPYSWIEVAIHKDYTGRGFEEFYFKGPLHKQLREALSLIKSRIIGEKVIKVKGQAEADRFFNYPYEAVEEALANAVYHKSYEMRNPIEVLIFPDKILVSSFPGPVPPVNEKMLKTNRLITFRNYRNRRIGDFLKGLDLTEGRGTGFPLIYDEMAKNGSPKPIFETDEDRTYFATTLPVHERYNEVDEQSDKSTKKISKKEPIKKLSDRQQKAVDYVRKNGSISNKTYQDINNCSDATAKRDLKEMVELGILKSSGKGRGLIYLIGS
jgi:ATP-dependent DNA helicase RecG